MQGKSLIELPKISQLIAGKNNKAINESANLFKKICKKIIKVSIIEAELVKTIFKCLQICSLCNFKSILYDL